MKLLQAIVFSLAFIAPTTSVTNDNKGIVYVCTGPKSQRYHKTPKCRGLKSCSGDIVEMHKAVATTKGYTPCKICY